MQVVKVRKWLLDGLEVGEGDSLQIECKDGIKLEANLIEVTDVRLFLENKYSRLNIEISQIKSIKNLSLSPINVSDFGAVGNANYLNDIDGLYYTDREHTTRATDDTVAINKAIKHAHSKGVREVVLSTGNYLINGYANPNTISLIHAAQQAYKAGIQLESDMILTLANASIVTDKVESEYSSLIVINRKKNVIVQGGKMRGDLLSHTAGNNNLYGIMICNASENIIVRDMELTEFTDDGLRVSDFTEVESGGGSTCKVLIENVYSHSNGRQGITISSGNDITIRGCRLNDQTTHSPTSAIDIELEGYDHIGVKNVLIEECEMIGNKYAGIILSNMFSEAPKNVNRDIIIRNNIISGSQHGIMLAGKYIGALVENNYIEIDSLEGSSVGLWSSDEESSGLEMRYNQVYSKTDTNTCSSLLLLSKGAIIRNNSFIGQKTSGYIGDDTNPIYKNNIEVNRDNIV